LGELYFFGNGLRRVGLCSQYMLKVSLKPHYRSSPLGARIHGLVPGEILCCYSWQRSSSMETVSWIGEADDMEGSGESLRSMLV